MLKENTIEHIKSWGALLRIDIPACGNVPCWMYSNENISGQKLSCHKQYLRTVTSASITNEQTMAFRGYESRIQVFPRYHGCNNNALKARDCYRKSAT